MISRAARRGLEKELPEWVSSGAITPQMPQQSHAITQTRRSRLVAPGFLLLVMLGSTLDPAGIVLLFA
ncbi:MAG: hypothetical protein H0X73_01220 [Chthoniobacterales bacterium]|nr:hypothetical protein [Chthoniobacterales bacterium]